MINRRGLVHERVRQARIDGDRIGIGTLVLGELIAGIENSKSRDRNLASFWHGLKGLTHWTFDKDAAIQFGQLQAALWRKGRNMQIPDIQIAAIALSLGNCVVVSKDSDLSAIPELQIEDWSK